MAILKLSDVFPHRKSITDVVSYATDPYAAVESKKFAALAQDVTCGDLIDSSGAKVLVVVSDFVTADSNKTVNVLRANAGLVCIKADALNAEGAVKEAAIAALAAKGFQLEGFHSVFTS